MRARPNLMRSRPLEPSFLQGLGAANPLPIKKAESPYSTLVTNPLSGTTPSLIQTEYAPIIFAMTTSVNSLSPTTATCEADETRSPKCAMISGPHAGFLSEWRRTLTPVARSRVSAWAPWGSCERVPEELETMRRAEGG